METNLKGASLKNLIVHYVGSKNNLDPLYLSKEALSLSDENRQIVTDNFLNKFQNTAEYFSFQHPDSLQYHEMYHYATELFANPENFEPVSAKMASHLYESSTHPKVKGGELYIGIFENLPVDSKMCKAIGLFKTENKSLFLDAKPHDQTLKLDIKEGTEVSKIDKGCLIIYANQTEGFDILIFDNQNRGEEAVYWREKFLNVTSQKNEYHQTAQFLTLTKQYITGQMESEFQIPRTEQIDLLHKSIDYFKSKESFDIEEFQSEVFQKDDMIESFRNFGSKYSSQHQLDIAGNFDISTQAVQKQSRIYKSVLKLDKNFHIYIHGNTDLIEKGMDMDGRKYYKIYYQDEK